jgi:site-specific recombinase XerC
MKQMSVKQQAPAPVEQAAAATHLLQSGTDIHTVQELLGRCEHHHYGDKWLASIVLMNLLTVT